MKESWKLFFTENNLITTINDLVKKIYNDNKTIYPPKDKLLTIFDLVDVAEVKVVIIGQDPYHQEKQAMGLAFSVNNDVKTPPSLKNIFKELESDLNINHFANNDLSGWVKQGVLLLNTIWTVVQGLPNSCKNMGWEEISKQIILGLYQENPEIIFCLWGKNAVKLYNKLGIDAKNIIISGHPSPFSYNKFFKGSQPFSKINHYLQQLNKPIINWNK